MMEPPRSSSAGNGGAVTCPSCDRLARHAQASIEALEGGRLKKFMLLDLMRAIFRHSSILHKELADVHDPLTARLAYYFEDDSSHLDLASYITMRESPSCSSTPSSKLLSEPPTSDVDPTSSLKSSVSTSTADLGAGTLKSSVSTSTADLDAGGTRDFSVLTLAADVNVEALKSSGSTLSADPSASSRMPTSSNRASQTETSGGVDLAAMLFELERHYMRAVTHNRMLRLTVTRLQEHSAALEAALKAKHFEEIDRTTFFGCDQGDNLRVLQDAFEEVDAALCHYMHPPGSKFQRPPRDYRDSHLWRVMPLVRRKGPAPTLSTPASKDEVARNRMLRDSNDKVLQEVAIKQRCIDPSTLPSPVIDLTGESDEVLEPSKRQLVVSGEGCEGYPMDISFPELTALSDPFDSLLVKTSKPACKLRRSSRLTHTSVDFVRLSECSAARPVASSSAKSPVDPPSPSSLSPVSTVELAPSGSPSDEDSMFGGASGSDWSDVELDDIEVSVLAPGGPPSEGMTSPSPSTSLPSVTPQSSSSHKRASSHPLAPGSELPPAKRAKATPKSSKPGAQFMTDTPSAHDVTMRDPKPGMFSRDIPPAARDSLSRVAGNFVLGHPDYFQGYPLVTPQSILGEWTKDDRLTNWRTEAMFKSIIQARPWRKLAKRWPQPVTFCIEDPNFTQLWQLIVDEVAKKAEWLWWRHHSLFFRSTTHFSPDTQAYIARRKSTCSMPNGLFRSVYIHVAELVHQNICTPDILTDVCFPRLSRSLVYLEPPPETSTYKELKAFFKAEDRKHPWRLYYAGSQLVHRHPFFKDLNEARQAIYKFTPLKMRRSLVLNGKTPRTPRSFPRPPSNSPPISDAEEETV